MERFCKIRVKEELQVWDEERGITKNVKVVPFRFNTVQMIMAQYVAWCWHLGVPVKLWLPKGRQQGSSTWWQLLLFAMCELRPGYKVATVAHVEKSSNEIFGKSRTAYRNIAPYQIYLRVEQGGYYEWDHESSLHVDTIKSADALGRGLTLDAIHFSEPGSYADRGIDATNAAAAIMQAVADHRWTIIVRESTAKGRDKFFFAGCMKAIDPSSPSVDRLIFLPWFLDAGYTRTWERHRNELLQAGKNDPGPRFVPTADESALREKLATTIVPRADRWHRYCHELTDEQLIWFRWALEAKCSGKEKIRKRAYPSFLEEAFEGSTQGFFEETSIQKIRDQARPPFLRGKLVEVDNRITLSPNPKGMTRIWKPPAPDGRKYVISADIGGEKARMDPFSAYVFDDARLEVVAQVHGNMHWEKFVDQLVLLGAYYHWALIVPENNHNPAVAGRIHDLHYPRLYYQTDARTGTGGKTPGFNTNKKTRPEILNMIEQVTRQGLLTCPDAQFSVEMENFVFHAMPSDPSRGVYKAASGAYDDRIMAAAIGVSQCSGRLEHLNESRLEESSATSATYRIYERLRERGVKGGPVRQSSISLAPGARRGP